MKIYMKGFELGEVTNNPLNPPKPLTDPQMRFLHIIWAFSLKDNTGHIGIGQPGLPKPGGGR